jgi:hypothetical protein
MLLNCTNRKCQNFVRYPRGTGNRVKIHDAIATRLFCGTTCQEQWHANSTTCIVPGCYNTVGLGEGVACASHKNERDAMFASFGDGVSGYNPDDVVVAP